MTLYHITTELTLDFYTITKSKIFCETEKQIVKRNKIKIKFTQHLALVTYTQCQYKIVMLYDRVYRVHSRHDSIGNGLRILIAFVVPHSNISTIELIYSLIGLSSRLKVIWIVIVWIYIWVLSLEAVPRTLLLFSTLWCIKRNIYAISFNEELRMSYRAWKYFWCN